ncbi:MAG: hypothetical protein K5669_05855 [Lachnospiraceae bacterium]|nr:hypothetical protein [Lachnospiraceae bacterium]
MKKADWKKALVIFRNGFAFVFSWLVIIISVKALIEGGEGIRLSAVFGAAFISIVGVLCFVVFFSDAFIKNKSFISRLTFAVIVFVPGEIAGFYMSGVFKGKGSMIQWLVFTGVVLVLYGICIVIDKTLCKKQGKEYTLQLMKYQEKRKYDNGKE